MNRNSSRFARLWRIGFLLIVGGWLAWILFTSGAIRQIPELVCSIAAWLFLFAWITLPIGLAWLWSLQVRWVTSIRIPMSCAFRIQGLAWAGRYLPGKAGLWIAKVALARSEQIPARSLAITVLSEQVLFLLAGAIVGVAALWACRQPIFLAALTKLQAHAVTGQSQEIGSVLALVGLAVAVSALLLVRVRRPLQAWFRALQGHLPSPPGLLKLLIAHGLLHVLVGIGLFVLLQHLLPESAKQLGIIGTVGALAIANVAGIAAVFAPAGLGVREVVLAALLAIEGNFEAALSAAVLVRALTLVADAGFSLMAVALGSDLGRSMQPRED